MNFFDRDLSWLSFNYRVLMEAMDPDVPPLERLKFLAIYSSNLDEFFRVRVANIRNLIQIDKNKITKRVDFTPDQLLSDIQCEVSEQLDEYGKTVEQVIHTLRQDGIHICMHIEEIPDALNDDMLHYFKSRVSAFLRPIWLGKEKVFLDNQAIYLAIQFHRGSQAIVNIPTDDLPRLFSGMYKDTRYFIFLDDIIRLHLDFLFPEQEVQSCHAIKLNKDADLQIDDEYAGELVEKIEKQIQKRNLGVPSRFLFDKDIPVTLLEKLSQSLRLSENDLITGGRYHNLDDFFEISDAEPSLCYPFRPELKIPDLHKSRSILKLMEGKDILMHFPYQSYDYVLQFFNEAAVDPDVTEINVTFYRIAKKSIIAESLITAAKNGKSVIVFMEVKARFDEANNLEWSRRLKNAGVKIIYSLPGLKVHAKVALVKKTDRMYGFFGTGNLNEKTSKIYCDYGLLTVHPIMTDELSSVFKYLYKDKQPGKKFTSLIVSQFGALERFENMINREIAQAQAGKSARIIVKVNNLQERNLIQKLSEASYNGVDVKLIVRSICCLIPTDQVPVKRIVDRYLEHARVFYFYNEGDEDIYMGSADWMNRNLHRRIEVCFPLLNKQHKDEILTILNCQWQDDVKGVWLSQDLENIRPDKQNGIRAQEKTYHYLKNQYG